MQILVALSLVSGSLACIGGLLGGGGGGCCPSAAPSCGNPCGPRPAVGYAAPPVGPPPGPVNAYPVAPSGPISPPIAVPPPPPPPPPPAAPAQADYIPSPLPRAPVQPIPFFGQTVGAGQPQGANGGYPVPQGFQHMVGASLGNFAPSGVFGQQSSGGFAPQPSAVSSYAQTPSAGGFQAVSNYAQQTLPGQPTNAQPVQQFVQQNPAVPDNAYAQRPVEQTFGDQGGVGNTGVGTAVDEAPTGGDYRAVIKNRPSVISQEDQISGGGNVNYDDIVDTSNNQGSFVAPSQPSPTINVQPAQTAQPFAPVDPVAPARPYTQPQQITQPVAPVPATTYTNTQIIAEPDAPQVPSGSFTQPQTVVTEVIKTVEQVPQAPFVQPSVPHSVPHTATHVQTLSNVQPTPAQPQVLPARHQPTIPSGPQEVSQEEPTDAEEPHTSIDGKPQVTETSAEGDDQHYDDSDALDQELPQPVQTAHQAVVAQPLPGQPQPLPVHPQSLPVQPQPQGHNVQVPQVAVSQSQKPIQPYHPQTVPQQVISTGSNVVPSAHVTQQHIPTSSSVQVVPAPRQPSITTVNKVITTQESHAAIDEIDGLLNPSTKVQTATAQEKQVHSGNSGNLDFKQVSKDLNTTPRPRSTIPSATRFSTTAPAATEATHIESFSNEEHYDDDEAVPETPTVHQVLPAQEPNKVEVVPAGKVLVDAAPEQQPRVTVPIPVIPAETQFTTARTATTTDIPIINVGQGSDYDEAPVPAHEDRAEVPVPAESFSGAATSAPESCAAGDPNCEVACKPGQHCGQEETEQEIVEPEQQNGFDYGDEAPTDENQKPIIVNSENEAKATGGNSNYVESRAKGIRQLETKPLRASGDLSPVEQYEARFRMAKKARRA